MFILFLQISLAIEAASSFQLMKKVLRETRYLSATKDLLVSAMAKTQN